MNRILIIEDDPALAHGLAVNLESAGYETESMDSGQAALVFLKNNDTDLVLLDINLPMRKALKYVRELKAGRIYR